MASNYENFLVTSVLLPRPMRQPFADVYAFCRTADDAADQSPTPAEALATLGDLRRDLDALFAGEPATDRFWPALADTVARFGLPAKPFHDLLDAFVQDQTKTRYASDDELLAYCRRSADPVGRLVLRLGGVDRTECDRWSDLICSGLQLANFWQDVSRDYAIGRIYLPADAMRRFGVVESMLTERSTPGPLRRLIADRCDQADEFLRCGLPLADQVPRWLGRSVRLFAHGGLETLAAIGRIDHDVLRERPVVSKTRQMRLVVQVLLGRLK